MANCRTPNVLVYVRVRGGKRSSYPAPSIPDLSACYWLRYENDGKQAWQRVGHYDSVQREKLLLGRRLSAAAQGFILPGDNALEKPGPARITIQATVDAYLESLRLKSWPTKTITGKTHEHGMFMGFCKKAHMDEIVSRGRLEFRDHHRVRRD